MDGKTGEFFFIEMNTRIQVEHPVTEAVTGVDLVRLQLAVAGGGQLGLRQQDIVMTGHAIECRINAEDPQKAFMPSPARSTTSGCRGAGRAHGFARVPRLLKLPPYYDSLLGKLIVWDESREKAIAWMLRALGELEIVGVKTTRNSTNGSCGTRISSPATSAPSSSRKSCTPITPCAICSER